MDIPNLPQAPPNIKQAQEKMFDELQKVKDNTNLASEKYKSINLIFFLIQFILFIGLIFASFKLFETIKNESQIGWVIGLIIVSIAGTVTVFSLQIYIIYKKILNGIIKNFWLQLFVSLFTGQIIAFGASTIFIDKMGMKMSFVQIIAFFGLLILWIGLGVGLFLSSGINLDDLIVNAMNIVSGQASSIDINNLGQTAEGISGGQVNASFFDDLIKMVTDTFSSLTGNLEKVQEVGGSTGLI